MVCLYIISELKTFKSRFLSSVYIMDIGHQHSIMILTRFYLNNTFIQKKTIKLRRAALYQNHA